MKIFFASLTALLISFSSIAIHAQHVHILKGAANDMPGSKVELLDFYADKNRLVSSATVDSDGHFQFSFSDDFPVGMYRLKFEKGRQVDVVYNRHDIELSITKPNVQAGRYSLVDGIDVISSGDSRLYYDFLKTLELRRKRIVILNQLKLLYPPSHNKTPPGRNVKGVQETGSFRSRIEVEMLTLHNEFETYIEKLIDDNPNSYAAKIIKTMKTPVLDVAMSGDGLKEWQKEHFWNNLDFSDQALLHSAIVPSKIFEYISLCINNRMSRDEQEMALVEAVDLVLSKARADETMFSVVLDIVTRRFEKSEYELIFIPESCT